MKLLKQLANQSWWPLLVVGVVIGLAVAVRLIGLDRWPPAPYWEEVALGYDGYSLALTGRDHHGHPWPLVAFESFGDYKPSGYFYTLLPVFWLSGLSVWTTRLPSALAGISIVISVMVLAKWWSPAVLKLSKASQKNQANWVAGLAGLVASVSPWLVHFSRAAWEVNVATALIAWAVVVAVAQLRQSKISWRTWLGWLGVIGLLVASMYTYHAARVVAPIVGLGLGLVWWWPRRWAWREWLGLAAMGVVVALIGVFPVLKAVRTPEVQTRIAQTSIFSQTSLIEESNLRISQSPGLMTKVLYHRNVLFAREIAWRYLSHFEVGFLFGQGDENARHSLQYFGLLYHIELVAVIAGVYTLLRRRSVAGGIILGWWAISLVPSAVSLATPHALRTLIAAPAVMLVIAFGWWSIGGWVWSHVVQPLRLGRGRAIGCFATILAIWLVGYGLEIGAAAVFYTQVYPQQYRADWMVGYEAMIKRVQAEQQTSPSETVWLTREQGRPMMYYWFFTQADPRLVQASNQTAKHDQGEILEYQTVRVVGTVDEVTHGGLVASSEKGWQAMVSRGQVTTIDTIRDGRGQVIWVVYRYQPR